MLRVTRHPTPPLPPAAYITYTLTRCTLSQGGLRATLLASWANVGVIYLALVIFMVRPGADAWMLRGFGLVG